MRTFTPMQYLGLIWLSMALAHAPAFGTTLSVVVRDDSTDALLPCRIHLRDDAGKPVKAGNLPFWRDHFVCPGRVELDVRPGRYACEIEHGPEWSSASRDVLVPESGQIAITNRLRRLADLAKEGWWSGDLHIHRAPDQIELHLQAEDLHIAPVITWWNKTSLWTNKALPSNPLVRFDKDRFYHLMGGEDERDGGALLYFDLSAPFDITAGQRLYPQSLVYAREIKRTNPRVWIDLEKPFWWDFPAWVAAGIGDSVGIANNHQNRSEMLDNEAWGKPRVDALRQNPLGNGLWTLEIYHHLLNCGFRLPPSAGSASGVLPNPVGYNRVYVRLERDLAWDAWWDGLRAGRCFVSNGPLLRCLANGQLPGHVFSVQQDSPLEISIEAALTSRDPITAVEIIRDGELLKAVPAEQLSTDRPSRFAAITFDKSGWFLVRAITTLTNTFRFASTGPFYVEVAGTPRRVSKRAAQFFYDWTLERIARIKLPDARRQEEVLRFYRDAEAFWKARIADANVP